MSEPVDQPAEQPPQPALKSYVLIPRLPSLAGYWQRLFALLLDLIFLHYFLRFSAWGLGSLLFVDERITTIGAISVFFLYFTSLNGPPGRGATIGKTILRMRVSTLDGQIPTWGQAFTRTALLFPFVFTIHTLKPFLNEWPEGTTDRLLLFLATFGLAIASIVANSVSASFNPFKQGMHDYWAGTVVRRINDPAIDFAGMRALLGPSWEQHYRQPQYSGRITFIIMYIGIGSIFWSSGRDPKFTAPFTGSEIIAGIPALEGARLATFQLIPHDSSLPPEDAPEFVETSSTLSLDDPDREPPTRVHIQLTRATAWPLAKDDPALQAAAEKFARMFLVAAEKADRMPEALVGKDRIAVEILLSTEADLILYAAERDHAIFHLLVE